ncbi:unnamed protein product [Hymenolepis diminuta]|uniref:Kynureninase n=1 Tax=Hymenolepis diminuta TaxID=6216 RepID=A0A0R3SY19_HYMDI|nr:unnamed protein product [Hymenolepis diminuta]VUZ51616.1 unnamed protein product [Hymenolepis diminuta]
MEKSKEIADYLDEQDPLKDFRSNFQIPTIGELKKQSDGEECDDNTEVIYLCTNSLGLPPKSTKENLEKVMESWRVLGVLSHTHGISPTEASDIEPKNILAEHIVGALPDEVAVMESLTSNIHTLLAAFYKPVGEKNKILIEKNAFPSDYYAVESQMHIRGVDKSSLIEIDLCPNGDYLTKWEIAEVITKNADKLALVWLPGVSYLTGQKLDIPFITRHVHEVAKCPTGFDLAHSVGNVEIKLHDWDVDFAAWCGYKYLCGSPGGCAGIFVHERHHMRNGEYAPTEKHTYGPEVTGWWGHRYSTRFQMTNIMEVEGGADSYRRSCPSMLLNSALTSSLRIFQKAGGMKTLVDKSTKLTNFFVTLLTTSPEAKELGLELISPASQNDRGSQISIKTKVDAEELYSRLIKRGVICDTRKPCYIRLAPFALYNSFNDVYIAANIIMEEIKMLSKS